MGDRPGQGQPGPGSPEEHAEEDTGPRPGGGSRSPGGPWGAVTALAVRSVNAVPLGAGSELGAAAHRSSAGPGSLY